MIFHHGSGRKLTHHQTLFFHRKLPNMVSFTSTSWSNKTFHCFREELFDRVMPFERTRENCRRKICDSVTHKLPFLLLSSLFSFS